MKRRRQRSLKMALIVQPLLLNLMILLVSFLVIFGLLLRFDAGGGIANEKVAAAAARAIVRQSDGSLKVRMTEELAALRARTPTLWFVAEDKAGRTVSFGQVPKQFRSLIGGLRHISYGQTRGRSEPYNLSTVILHETGPAGSLGVLAHGRSIPVTLTVMLASNVVVAPIFVLLALASFIMTPWIVNRSLAGVSRIAQEARALEIDRPGIRLSGEFAPVELEPLVTAMNEALRRIDESYHRQRRFIAAAAHELRTPIAILRIKIDAAADATARKLSGDVARLANLAEQLLDLHRIEDAETAEAVELGPLMRHVVADIAPLLIAAGKTIDLAIDNAGTILADPGAMTRVVNNLVLNALEHGGRRITVRVQGTMFQVEDDGPGIPAAERDRLFEPFQRLRPRSGGTGLGLHLVQQVVERYGGKVTIRDGSNGGALVCVDFPARL